ncbi:uncharacterized protein LOC111708348 [Eurytemora carolleeae]|uniref:uncharacterized protein LOC111708348 n=1 Tax=Eurytemora carolleeae TaxID=1294199 RepID=UPI000C777AE4|nr:uncharacterized protein LOC111708348 [Eurytemora carolleeae]|eukprot:XP_023337450.1 uncharacterized protein LOC111708348 [Eurytemora affinis]
MRFHLCLLFYQVYCTISSADNDVFIVSSIEGEQARLPCDIHSRKNDSVYLVLWYRKDSGTPIYSYDSRPGGGLQDRSLWSEPKAFGSRAYYHINSNPSMLAVSDLKGVDSGTYTCRVDYTQSPTVYHHVRLDVTVPPVTLMIIGDRGREITDNNPIGPFKEGDPFTVLCVATGGKSFKIIIKIYIGVMGRGLSSFNPPFCAISCQNNHLFCNN